MMERCHVNNVKYDETNKRLLFETESVVERRKNLWRKTTVSVERFIVCNKVKFVGVWCENTRTRTSPAEVCRKEAYGTEAQIGVHAFARKPRLTFRVLCTQWYWIRDNVKIDNNAVTHEWCRESYGEIMLVRSQRNSMGTINHARVDIDV